MDINDLAVKYLAQSMKTEKQVRDYLARKEFAKEEIDKAIDSLKDWNYLDDVEYAKVAFRVEYAKGRGKFRIVNYLKQKGVKTQDIEKGYEIFLASEDGQNIDETKIALDVAKKLAQNRELDDKLKAKISRNLSTRGFTTNTIYNVINKLNQGE